MCAVRIRSFRIFRRNVRVAIAIFTLSASILLYGCATGVSPKVPRASADPFPAAGSSMLLRPGDIVDVKFLYWPELDETQHIRPDGKISLALVDEVDASGVTPDALRHRLLSLYDEYLKDPEIRVMVDLQENRRVYVGGEVNLRGSFSDGLQSVPLIGKLTALEAIIQAGGFRERSAKVSTVLIVRRIEDTQYARTIDLSKPFTQSEGTPFYLEPNDVVYVPRTKIDRVNQWVTQYMGRTVPDWLDANVSYNLN